MGELRTATYRLEIWDNAGFSTMIWRSRANEQTLMKFLDSYCRGLEAGGVNEHVSKSLGYVPYPKELKIVHQKTNEVKVQWKAAAFQVY